MSYIPDGVHYYPYIYWTAGKWETIYECKACGSRGDLMAMDGDFDPCPRCARKDKKQVTARWIDTTPAWSIIRFWHFPEKSGYWQTREEFF